MVKKDNTTEETRKFKFALFEYVGYLNNLCGYLSNVERKTFIKSYIAEVVSKSINNLS